MPFTDYTAQDVQSLVSTNLEGFLYVTQSSVLTLWSRTIRFAAKSRWLFVGLDKRSLIRWGSLYRDHAGRSAIEVE